MILYLYVDLKTTARKSVGTVVSEVVKASLSGKQYEEINLKQTTNLLSLTKLNLDFAGNQVITSRKTSNTVTNKEIQEFREKAWEFIVGKRYLNYLNEVL